jgi:outer membrane protein assembly factor BamB
VGDTLSFDSLTQTLYLGTESGVVTAVAASNGTVRWAHDAVGEVTSAPAFDGKQVYVGFREPGGSVALEKRSGRQAWRTVAVGWVARDPVVQLGGVFFVSASELLVLRPQTGQRAATYRLSIPAGSSLRKLFATEVGVAAGYNGAQESGIVHVPDVRRAASTTVSLNHRVDRVVPRLPGSVLVHGASISGGGDVLTSIDLSAGKVKRAAALHRDSRLLGSVDDRVFVSSVPPGVLALNADTFATAWTARRYHSALEALRGPERRVSPRDLPKDEPVPASIAVTGRGREGLVGYDPETGEIRYHFAIDADLIVRGAARDDDRILLLVTTPAGGRASLMALGLAGN